MTDRNFEPIRRTTVPELDLILGKPFPVLDDGFIRLVDYMGSDQSIVQAARVSYGEGTKKVNEDRGLIRYLMRHRHTTPLEMCELKIHIRIPMDAWRQMIRHRSANVNEYSTRYSLAIDEKQTTGNEEWRAQSTDNKQGSAGFLDAGVGELLSAREFELHDMARQVYQERIDAGVAREQARKDLPLSTYTEAYWKIDLHNLLHFLSLRMDSHAQKEIRDYANVIGNEIVAKWVPLAWEAFKDYRMGSVNLSSLEQRMLTTCSGPGVANDLVISLGKEVGWFDLNKDGKLKRIGERIEFEQKYKTLYGYDVPWLRYESWYLNRLNEVNNAES